MLKRLPSDPALLVIAILLLALVLSAILGLHGLTGAGSDLPAAVMTAPGTTSA